MRAGCSGGKVVPDGKCSCKTRAVPFLKRRLRVERKNARRKRDFFFEKHWIRGAPAAGPPAALLLTSQPLCRALCYIYIYIVCVCVSLSLHFDGSGDHLQTS
jgi:hypothetical protein